MACELAFEVAGLAIERGELGEHARNDIAQRVARGVSLLAYTLVARARLIEHLGGGAHAAHAHLAVQALAHRSGLAARPAVVLGKLDQAIGEVRAQRAEFVHQVVPVGEQAAHRLAGLLHLLGHGRRGPFAAQSLAKLGQGLSGRHGPRISGRQRGAHREFQARHHGVPPAGGQLPGGVVGCAPLRGWRGVLPIRGRA